MSQEGGEVRLLWGHEDEKGKEALETILGKVNRIKPPTHTHKHTHTLTLYVA